MRSAGERVWALSGAGAVVLFVLGLLFGDLLASSRYPPVNASAVVVRRYFVHSAGQVRALSFLHALSALALAAFVAYLAVRIRRLGDAWRWASVLALAGGVPAAAFLLVSAISYRILAEPSVASDGPLAHGLVVLSYLSGGTPGLIMIAGPLGCGAVLAFRRVLLPRWSGWLALAGAITSIGSVTWVLGPLDNRSALYAIVLLAAICGFGWVLVASVWLADGRSRSSLSPRRTRQGRTTGASRSPSSE